MPGKDGTGPRGMDATAGRGWGRGVAMGRRGGRGAGGGHGWRHGFSATDLVGSSLESELATLKQQAVELERALGALKSRIQEIEQPTAAD